MLDFTMMEIEMALSLEMRVTTAADVVPTYKKKIVVFCFQFFHDTPALGLFLTPVLHFDFVCVRPKDIYT